MQRESDIMASYEGCWPTTPYRSVGWPSIGGFDGRRVMSVGLGRAHSLISPLVLGGGAHFRRRTVPHCLASWQRQLYRRGLSAQLAALMSEATLSYPTGGHWPSRTKMTSHPQIIAGATRSVLPPAPTE
jgi:hypothetical protein